MSTSANGASDTLGMGPSAGYNLISVITAIYVLTVSICMSCLHAVAFFGDIHMHIYVVTNLLMLYFWIKLTIKLPNYLTETLSRGYMRCTAADCWPYPAENGHRACATTATGQPYREDEKREREASRVMEGDSPIVIILIVMFRGS